MKSFATPTRLSTAMTGLLAALAMLAVGVRYPAGAAAPSKAAKIQHVVVVVQEARSFDDLFCSYPGANGSCAGLAPIRLEANCTLSDTFADFVRDRRTGDFSHERADCPGRQRPQYGYVPKDETRPYYAIAGQYVLADAMFSSTGNPTFEAHQFAIAAQSGAKDEPFGSAPSDGCYYRAFVRELSGPPVPSCFSYATLASELAAVGLDYAYYAAGSSEPAWDAFGWVQGYAPGTSPPTQFLSDIAAGKLAAVTWVTPEYADSDVSGSRSNTGPRWVAAVVNAVGASSFWDSTAIFVTWSGFGGWSDHVPPPYIDVQSLGFRVPLLVVGPYAKAGYVSHVQYETASILRFAEDTFGLPRLAASDARANSPVDAFDFTKPPRRFVPIGGR